MACSRESSPDNMEIVKLLIQYGANVDVNCGEPFLKACYHGNTLVVHELMRANAIKRCDTECLTHVIETCYYDIARLLVELGFDFHACKSGLSNIIIQDDMQFLQLLLANGLNVETANYDALFVALCYDRQEIVTLLIECGARTQNLNINDPFTRSLLDVTALLLKYRDRIGLFDGVIFRILARELRIDWLNSLLNDDSTIQKYDYNILAWAITESYLDISHSILSENRTQPAFWF